MGGNIFDPVTFVSAQNLRATRPRLRIAELLFSDGLDRHVTAEQVATKLKQNDETVALATIYNTLHNFVDVGILRQVMGTARGVIVFDTNTTPHQHLFNETTGELIDISPDLIDEKKLPPLPEGSKLVSTDVIIRIR